MNVLKSYQDALQSYGYTSTLRPADAEIAVDILVITLSPDSQGRPRQLTLRYNEVPLQDTIEQQEHPELGKSKETFLQFYTLLPFTYQPEVVGELARLLLFYNKGTDIAGFGLSEVDGQIYYQYTLHSSKPLQAARLLVGIVGNIELFLDSLSDSIEAVATSKQSMKAVLLGMLPE